MKVHPVLNLYDRLRQQPPHDRTKLVFAFIPRRDPITKNWYWIKRVYITQRLSYKIKMLSWGMGPIIQPKWTTQEVKLHV